MIRIPIQCFRFCAGKIGKGKIYWTCLVQERVPRTTTLLYSALLGMSRSSLTKDKERRYGARLLWTMRRNKHEKSSRKLVVILILLSCLIITLLDAPLDFE